nr:RecName: Full=Bacteriocin [Rhizobium leguminosarum bv. viciae]
ASILTNAS